MKNIARFYYCNTVPADLSITCVHCENRPKLYSAFCSLFFASFLFLAFLHPLASFPSNHSRKSFDVYTRTHRIPVVVSSPRQRQHRKWRHQHAPVTCVYWQALEIFIIDATIAIRATAKTAFYSRSSAHLYVLYVRARHVTSGNGLREHGRQGMRFKGQLALTFNVLPADLVTLVLCLPVCLSFWNESVFYGNENHYK